MGNVRFLTNKMDELDVLKFETGVSAKQFNVFHQDVAAGAYSTVSIVSAQISDNKGGQRYEEEWKKQRLWNCSACQQQMV